MTQKVYTIQGIKVLIFPDKPGAKFTDRATCERIVDELRDMGH